MSRGPLNIVQKLPITPNAAAGLLAGIHYLESTLLVLEDVCVDRLHGFQFIS